VGARGSVAFRVRENGNSWKEVRKNGGQAPSELSIPVTAGSTLQLGVDPLDGNPYDHADWGDAHLVCGDAGAAGSGGSAGSGIAGSGGAGSGAAGSGGAGSGGSVYHRRVYLSDLPTTGTPENGWGPFERDRSNGEQPAGDGRSLVIAGTLYPKGLGVHANGRLQFTAPAGCSTFKAKVGIDDEVGARGSVVFAVYYGASQPWTSAEKHGGEAPTELTVPVNQPVITLEVRAGAGNPYDHADWADAFFECAVDGNADDPSTPGYDGEGVACGSAVCLGEDVCLDRQRSWCGPVPGRPGYQECDGPEDCAGSAAACVTSSRGIFCGEPITACEAVF
jgi:hypothetical protein